MPYFKNDNINILFIHIPKTGGSSFETYLSKKYNIKLNYNSLFSSFTNTILPDNLKNISLQHQTYNNIKKYSDILKINFTNIKIISFVRNPYERIISDLFFWNLIDKNTDINIIPNIILKYIKENPNKYDNHNIPQNKFLVNEDNKLYSDIIIIKMENLNEELIKNGFNDFQNKHEQKNKYGKLNYYNYLNKESIKLINNHYAKDFELFNYKKIDGVVYSIFTNVKNEPDIIEWCYYHLHILKFNHIVICDNNSNIPVINRINNHNFLKNKVKVFKLEGSKIKNKAKEIYFQQYAKLSDWTLFIDADEYLVLKNINNIHKFMDNNIFKNNIDCITFNWKMMGSNNLLKRNNKLVIDNYNECESNLLNQHVKSLVYNKNVLNFKISPHIFKVKNNIIDSSGKLLELTPFNNNQNQTACIFHFWCKSKEDWINKCNTCKNNNGCDDGGGLRGREIERWNQSLNYKNTDDYLKQFTNELINIIKENGGTAGQG